VHVPDGAERFPGFADRDPGSDVERWYDHPSWLNVDGRMGLVYCGTGRTRYLNRHHFPVWRAVADDLTLSCRPEPFRVAPGGVAGELAAAVAPGYSAARTAGIRFSVLRAPRHAAGLLLGKALALANFAASARVVRLQTAAAPGKGRQADAEPEPKERHLADHVLQRDPASALLNNRPIPRSFVRCQRLVGGKVKVETVDVQRVRKKNFRLQARLNNPGLFEVPAGPIQHLADRPFGSQRGPPHLNRRMPQYRSHNSGML